VFVCMRCAASWETPTGVRRACPSCGSVRWHEPFDPTERKTAERHGLTQHPLYHTWNSMIRRCTIKHYHAYKYYGGRGIAVCERWLSFPLFIEDMESTHKPGLTLERKDNNKGYEKDNCIWATSKEQTRNTRRNRFVEINGVSKTRIEWMEIYGVKKPTLQSRLRKMDIVAALTLPVAARYVRK